MLSADPLAFRPGAPEEPPPSPRWPLGPAPTRLATRSTEPLGQRIRRSSLSTGVSTLVHVGLVVAFLSVWHSMMRDLTTPQPEGITVDLVRSVPGEEPPPPKKEPAPAKPPAPSASPAPAPPPPADPAPPATPTSSPKPSPKPSALDEALGRPALVEPPPEAKAAASQATTNQLGNSSTSTTGARDTTAGAPDAPQPDKEPAKPPPTPQVLTAQGGDASVPAATKAPQEAEKPQTRGDPAQAAKSTAQLSAALALDSMAMPLSFRAALSARGSSDNATYRGSVFGAISRVRESVQSEARQKQLKGQVVIALVLTEEGGIASLRIVQSSGDPATDAFAVTMLQRAAPYPPPPPGASHTFTPAITFGG